MKLIGFLFCYFAYYSLASQITFSGVLWMVFGILLLAGGEIKEIFMHTERFIHRSNSNVKK